MGNELLRKGDDDEDKKETADITGSSMLVTTSTVDDGSNDGQSIVEVLGLECLSIVLSYLTECDGTCLLLCRQHYWTDTVLPLFRRRRRRPSASWDGANGTTNNTTTTTTAAAKYRHTYQVVTIPDATVRLARLNTRRWSTKQKQQQKQKQDRCRIDRRHKDINDTTPIITTKGSLSSSSSSIIMKTTEELAENEWNTTTTTVVTNTLQHVSHHDEYALPYLLRMYNANPPANSKSKSKQAPTIPTLPPVFRQGLTSIASYPRSGNTLLRNLLETVTGYVTSSDTRPDRTLSRALADRPPYFVGEGLAPNNNTNNNNSNNVSNTNTNTNHYVSPFLTPSLPSPPICKTHWPERVGCHVYQSNRVVLLIRNPYDTVDSYWHMNLTNTHTQKVRPGITHHHKAFYVSLVKDEICSVWLPFIQYYYTTCKTQNIPLLFVRYEDLIMNQKHELHRILQFVCCNDTNTNNYNNNDNNNNDDDDYQTQEGWWKHRLDEMTRKNTSFGYRSSSSSATTPDSSTAAAVAAAAATVKKTSTNNDSSHNPCSNNDDDDDVAVPTNGVAVAASVVTNSRCSHHPSIGRSLRTPGLFPQQLLRDIHDYDDDYCATIYDDSNNSPNTSSSQSAQNDEVGWLERLGYHVYKQGFPNNLNNLPPVPVLEVVPSSSSSSPVVPSSSLSTDAPAAVAVAAANYNFNATATTTNTNTNNYINNSGGSTTTEESKPLPSLTINSPDVSLELRSRDSPYGRNMRRWRRKYTANDTKPFPTL